MSVVVALGDSLTCGEGVGVRVPPAQTWVARFTAAVRNGTLVRLAEPGARIGDIRRQQLQWVPPADIVTLVVGLNDIARSGFDASAVRENLKATVGSLIAAGCDVLLGRLHDPTRLLPFPRRLKLAAQARVAMVNAAVDEVAASPSVYVLDLARVSALQHAGGWATDRIHPSRVGHQAIAAAATEALQHRADVTALAEPEVPAGPSLLARSWWTARHGLPYIAGHLGELGQPVASAVLRRA